MSSPASPFWFLDEGCDLLYNLDGGNAANVPHTNMSFGDSDRPDDLAEKFYFENLTVGASGDSHSFVLTSVFPLVTPAGDAINTTVAHFLYRFSFQVGSPRTYCFLPYTLVTGGLAYDTSGLHPALMSVLVSYGVKVGGNVRGSIMTQYWTPITGGESTSVHVNLFKLWRNDPSYRPLAVALDPQEGDAEIDVWIQLAFHNGPSEVSVSNPDGHFVLDCEKYGGHVGCDLIKWGSSPTVPM